MVFFARTIEMLWIKPIFIHPFALRNSFPNRYLFLSFFAFFLSLAFSSDPALPRSVVMLCEI